MTDLAGCCTGPGRGHWIYPDGFVNADGNSLVRNNPSDDDIFRSRGNMVVRLERRNNAIGPTGRYCCQVPTMATPNTNSTMCVILSEFHGVRKLTVHVPCTYIPYIANISSKNIGGWPVLCNSHLKYLLM